MTEHKTEGHSGLIEFCICFASVSAKTRRLAGGPSDTGSIPDSVRLLFRPLRPDQLCEST
jgi:hypothetical protein